MVEIRIYNSGRARLAALVLCLSGAASAQEATNATEAARHFDRGYLLAQQGSLEAAIAEFKQAHALSPHPSVLYNLGQAYAASGRAVQAVQTLRKYLETADPKLDAERRAQASAVMEYQAQRIGTLELEIEPSGAELSLDAEVVGTAPLPGALSVTAGTHALTVSRAGYTPRTLRIDVVAGQLARQQVKLEPSGAAQRIRVSCGVPDVNVLSGGAVIAHLPRGGEVVSSQPLRTLRFERAGFLPQERAVPDSQEDTVDCGLRDLDPSAKLLPVHLEAPERVQVHIDSFPFRSGKLPPGRHVIALSGRGVEPTERWVSLSASQPKLELDVREATDILVDERNQRRSWQRVSALVVGGVGLASLAGAGVIYAVNQSEYETWRDDGQRLAERMNARSPDVSAGEWNQLLERENALRNRDAAALGLAVLGGALTVTGAALWLTAPAPAETGVTLQVGERAWLGYSGRF